MKNIKVSIVCITYNHEKFIGQTIESFLAQKVNFEYEIIVADDSSTDNTQSVIREYAKNNKSIVPVLRKKNLGVQKNLIDSFIRTRGEYIILCEGDDFWTDPTKLQSQVDFLDSHPEYSLTFHQAEVFSEDEKGHVKSLYISPEKRSTGEVSVKTLLTSNIMPTNTVLYRKPKEGYSELNEKVMPFDWYLHAFHAKHGKIHFVNKVMAKNRRHAGGVWSVSRKKSGEIWTKHQEGWTQLFEEHLRLFPEHSPVIGKNASNLFNQLFINLSISDFLKYVRLLKGYQNILSQYLEWSTLALSRDRQEVNNLKIHSNRQGEYMESQNQTITDLKNELHAIKNSKLWHITHIRKGE